jgi:ADP-heptose:LPS heptosyltransferase
MRILVIRCGALGDLVYSTSIIEALKLEYGTSTIIDFVTTPGSGTLFKYDKRVNSVLPLRYKKFLFFLVVKKRVL